jgi:hypothetical protein
MTGFARSSPPAGHVHLQFVGDVPGVPAAELGPGDRLMWNGGGTSTVVSVRDASRHYVEILEAWPNTATGETEQTPRRLKKTRLVARVPVENWAAGDHRPMFGRTDRDYLRAVRTADLGSIAPWRTGVCPRCGQAPAGANAVGAGGQVVTADDGQAHVIIAGVVVLGCEGFRVVDPAAVGLDRDQWEDWRQDPGPAYYGAEVLADLADRHRVMIVDGAAADLGEGAWSFSVGFKGTRLQVVVAPAGTAVVPVRPVTDAELDAAHYPGYAADLATLRKVGMDRAEDYDLDGGDRGPGP